MQVFKISGKFEKDGQWSERESDFIGYFIKRRGEHVIEGYLEEQNDSPNPHITYIKGLYINAHKLAFLNMCNDSDTMPIVYDFPKNEKQGFWSRFRYGKGFFDKGSYDGHVIIHVQKVKSRTEKSKHEQKIAEIFAKESADATKLNQDLMDDSENLVDFLNEGTEWYPKEK